MRMYNCAAVISRGKIHALVPKTYIPNYNEFYEKRWFSSGSEVTEDVAKLLGEPVPVLPRAVFRVGGTLLGVEICEDMWTPLPPSTFLALNGAEVILNLSASNETIGKRAYRRGLVQHQSAALNCVYAYCSAGSTESTQDLIFSGQSLIGEDGRLLAETGRTHRVGLYAGLRLRPGQNPRRPDEEQRASRTPPSRIRDILPCLLTPTPGASQRRRRLSAVEVALRPCGEAEPRPAVHGNFPHAGGGAETAAGHSGQRESGRRHFRGLDSTPGAAGVRGGHASGWGGLRPTSAA